MSTTLDIKRGAEVRLDPDLSAEIRDLGAAAGALLDRPVDVGECTHARAAKRALSQVWDDTLAQLGQPPAPDQQDRVGELTELLGRVRRLEARVDDARVAESVEMMRRIRSALATLDEVTTVDQLLSRATEETCTLGFDRASVSTVDDVGWRMHDMCIERDPQLAADMVTASRKDPPRLDGSLIESDVVDGGRPGLVLDVQNNPRVSRELVAMSGCTSYGVAPLTTSRRVVGLVHADSFYPRRDMDPTDLAVLALYAKGVSQTMERVCVLEGVASLQSEISRLMGGVAIPHPATARREEERAGVLSAREMEVMELMAAGKGNLSIARLLSISEGTVKTHITHILRKLDASNRAEAVAYWLRR